jgi:hypothetical protein
MTGSRDLNTPALAQPIAESEPADMLAYVQTGLADAKILLADLSSAAC